MRDVQIRANAFYRYEIHRQVMAGKTVMYMVRGYDDLFDVGFQELEKNPHLWRTPRSMPVHLRFNQNGSVRRVEIVDTGNRDSSSPKVMATLVNSLQRKDIPYVVLSSGKNKPSDSARLSAEAKHEFVRDYSYDPSLGRDQTVVITVKNTNQELKNRTQLRKLTEPDANVFGREQARAYRKGIIAALNLDKDEIDWDAWHINHAYWTLSDDEPYDVHISGQWVIFGGS